MTPVHFQEFSKNFNCLIDTFFLNFDNRNTELVSLTGQYIFTKPFDKSDSTNRLSEDISSSLPQLYDNPQVLEAAAVMKNLFLTKKECLLHGDLHTGSVMVDDGNSKVSDLTPKTVDRCSIFFFGGGGPLKLYTITTLLTL